MKPLVLHNIDLSMSVNAFEELVRQRMYLTSMFIASGIGTEAGFGPYRSMSSSLGDCHDFPLLIFRYNENSSQTIWI